MPPQKGTADSKISHSASISYWNKTPSTINGMLGGFEELDPIDIEGSKDFLKRFRPNSAETSRPFARCVDCGAGIGRITRGLLGSISDIVDIVEPVSMFTDVIKLSEEWQPFRDQGKLGKIYSVGLEAWQPEHSYDLIWIQWCVGHLTDKELKAFLLQCKGSLNPEGCIVLKENMSSDPQRKDMFDEEDSSVTRSHEKFMKLFQDAGLNVELHEEQDNFRNFPITLFKVRMYGLRPDIL